MKTFSQVRAKPTENFPHPAEGEVVFENPPCFIWLKDSKNTGGGYTLKIKGKNGFRREYSSDKCYFTPNEIFPAGEYKWDVISGERHSGKKSFTIDERAVELIRPTGKELFDAIDESVHPRALFFSEDIPEILENHKDDVEVLKRNIALAYENGMPKPPYDSSFDVGETGYAHMRTRNYIGYIREYVDRNLIALSLGWALLRDAKAAELGKKLLLTICSWNHEDDTLSIFERGGDEAGLSMSRCLAVAFDLLYDALAEDERKAVLKTVALVARQTYENIVGANYEDAPSNSHVGRTPAYLGLAAIVLKGYDDDETVRKYLDISTEIYGGPFPYYGNDDGGWGEGVFYSTSYTKWYLPFFCAVLRYTGKSYLDRPFYQNFTNFLLHFADREFENHPFGDGYWCGSDDEEWQGFFAQNPFRVYAERFGPEEARKKEKSIPNPEIFKLHLLDIFLPKQKAPAAHLTREASLAEAFGKTGFLSMRSSFETKDCIAVMARASKYGSASHSHADQGSFALFYEGTSLISPSGYYGWGYGMRHHLEWTNTSRAHNTILVNGVGQPTFSEKPTGEVEYCRQDGDIFKASMKLDNAYGQLDAWTRTLTMNAKEKTLIVEDRVISKEETVLDWLLHTLGRPWIENGGVYVWRNGITLKIETIEGLSDEVVLSDCFDVDVNEGIGDRQKAVAPDQFHISYKTKRAKIHNIKVKFSITK